MSVSPTTSGPNPPGGIFDGPVHLYAVRVYYEDTDLSGITYHANYLRWFERARSDILRLLDIDQREAIEAGEGAYAVVDLAMKYLRPAKLDDDVVIKTLCTDLRSASVKMHQRAFRGDELLTEALFRVGFVSPEGRPKRQPDAWREAFKPVLSEEIPQ
ncbi:YbgC/FadM family acyl-CoA thioesterase [Parerythrobacter jejuensis]|uniref:YbgC/FadM family acyl-CoA thioesterase n=1 Tax=Parerythrobacter jejuensis TaxID=795812 RepID=A0A845AW76_9SPHN|nr:YbgC/FadM family acyl-CoA thioesterase [Parerythrobacter jejuensis]MXP30281.1 YbgC/FadM family acyl-CoA thioesterase [Parerythrobacter jejuensis]MXP33041.1 YbgC/FadM family acyl-CoA thioesterase [Parerythrobacter jejuensis]